MGHVKVPTVLAEEVKILINREAQKHLLVGEVRHGNAMLNFEVTFFLEEDVESRWSHSQ